MFDGIRTANNTQGRGQPLALPYKRWFLRSCLRLRRADCLRRLMAWQSGHRRWQLLAGVNGRVHRAQGLAVLAQDLVMGMSSLANFFRIEGMVVGLSKYCRVYTYPVGLCDCAAERPPFSLRRCPS